MIRRQIKSSAGGRGGTHLRYGGVEKENPENCHSVKAPFTFLRSRERHRTCATTKRETARSKDSGIYMRRDSDQTSSMTPRSRLLKVKSRLQRVGQGCIFMTIECVRKQRVWKRECASHVEAIIFGALRGWEN